MAVERTGLVLPEASTLLAFAVHREVRSLGLDGALSLRPRDLESWEWDFLAEALPLLDEVDEAEDRGKDRRFWASVLGVSRGR